VSDHEVVYSRLKAWHIGITFLLLVGGALAVFQWRNSTAEYDPPRLLHALPLDQAVKVYIDVDALRSARLLEALAGSPGSEESDYRRFVEETGFNYRTDLNAAAASFVHGDVYIAARGRFDWKRLVDYAGAQGGTCANATCTMPASQPGRNVSYHLLRKNVLAIAVSGDKFGVSRIVPPKQSAAAFVPGGPVWISAPGEAFDNLSGLPDGSHMLSPLTEAQEVSFNVLEKEIRLDAACKSPEVAARVVQEFTTTTNLLRAMLQRDKLTPSASDLSGVLVAGKFEAKASHAIGTWPLEKQFIESLFAGTAR
jgi:hypothetical protein